MASPFDGLPAIFLGAFGQAVTHTPEGGSPVEVAAIYINRPEDSLGVVQSGPVLHVTSAVAATIARGDAIAVAGDDGGTFVVGPRERDGKGMVTLTLQVPA